MSKVCCRLLDIFFWGTSKHRTMSLSPFNFPQIGEERATGSKFGDTSGTSQDVTYPVSQLIGEAAQPGSGLRPGFGFGPVLVHFR